LRQAAAEQDHGGHGAETVRACALTRARRPKDELIRFVLGPDGTVVPDLKEKLPGRGVWLTAARDIVGEAAKRNVFARALRTEAKVPEGLAAEVEQRLSVSPRRRSRRCRSPTRRAKWCSAMPKSRRRSPEAGFWR
jgi:predicted RNA-binding protein YlxR (DUF448 family)